MESAIRQKLHDAYMELAEQATVRRQWEAASAFQYAAGLALGLTVKVEATPTPTPQTEAPKPTDCSCIRPVLSEHSCLCLRCGGLT